MTITLRPRQETFVTRCEEALRTHGNTLGIAPTGAGKTIMMSATLARSLGTSQWALVLQHRQELLEQNQDKFLTMNPSFTTSLFTASQKNTGGQVIFGMVQTVCREHNLAKLSFPVLISWQLTKLITLWRDLI